MYCLVLSCTVRVTLITAGQKLSKSRQHAVNERHIIHKRMTVSVECHRLKVG